MTKNDLENMFGFFSTDEEKLEAVVDLGKTLNDKVEKGKNCISGCASKVDLEIEKNERGLKILANSDSIIVRGFLVIFKTFYAKNNKETIWSFLEKLGLKNILTTQRQNGIKEIIKHIEKYK
ncbi:MAG: SufE family protein [Alphaproteobacteria bacterium]